MAINIKNREAETLIADLKRMTGKGTSQLLLELLRQEHQRLSRLQQTETLVERMRSIGQRVKTKLGGEPIDTDRILGYDQHGLPQ
jgi:hypothetical protein